MRKAVIASILAFNTGAFADLSYIGAGYFDSDGFIDKVYHEEEDHCFEVKYTAHGDKRVCVTNRRTNLPMTITTNVQEVILDKDNMLVEYYLNVTTPDYKWGSVLIPSNGATTTPLRYKQPVDKWHNVGLVPCNGGARECPVLTRHGIYRVADGIEFAQRRVTNGRGDMCGGGAGSVVYIDSDNEWWLNCWGRNGSKMTAPILEGQGTVEGIMGTHKPGFSVRAADPANETGLFLVSSELNRIAHIVKPWDARNDTFFLEYYLRDVEGSGNLALAPVGVGGCAWGCSPEPTDSVKVDEYAFIDLWDLFQDRIDSAFSDPDIGSSPQGCRLGIGRDGYAIPSVSHSYGTSPTSHTNAEAVRFTARFKVGTSQQEEVVSGRTYLTPDPIMPWKVFPVKVWKAPAFGLSEFEADGWQGFDNGFCVFIPYPDRIDQI